MLKVLISGCNGHMGRVLTELCREMEDVEIAAGFDLLGRETEDFPVYSSPAVFSGEAHVLIDFSAPAALPALLAFGTERKIPLVLATTGAAGSDSGGCGADPYLPLRQYVPGRECTGGAGEKGGRSAGRGFRH